MVCGMSIVLPLSILSTSPTTDEEITDIIGRINDRDSINKKTVLKIMKTFLEVDVFFMN
jgi:hypothetical protein